jgi:hypothetical protein
MEVGDSSGDSGAALAATSPYYACVLTGDCLFSTVHKHELVEDGLAYRIYGSVEGGLALLALEPSFVLPASGDLPLRVVDMVRWSKLKQLHLDKSDFVMRWQRYVAALQRRLEALPSGGAAAAEQLLLRSHAFARKLLQNFDELDFLIGSSESPDGPIAILHYLDDQPLTPFLYVLAAGAERREREQEPPAS